MAAQRKDFDVVVVGGGMVGASLACALGGRDLQVAVIEAVPYQAPTQPSYDDRVIALSYGSRQIFDGLGIWPAMQNDATPIHHIHVSEKGQFGCTRLDHRSEGVDALGYVIPARAIGHALTQHLATLNNVKIIAPARVMGMQLEAEWNRVDLADPATGSLRARLVVAADGGRSMIRELMGVPVTEKDYGQSAIIANVSVSRPKPHVAYERFTPSGPLALLPLGDARYSVVWTQRNADLDSVMALEDAAFLHALEDQFSGRLGRLSKVGKRSAYPLKLIYATQQVQPRVALIGNAAHTLHPIAGQGFNLGLRDVAALAQVLIDTSRRGGDLGELQNLQAYAEWRQQDQRRMIKLTDTLVQIFSNAFAPLQLARNAGLILTDIFPVAKQVLARHTMGMAGKLPRLARRLPL